MTVVNTPDKKSREKLIQFLNSFGYVASSEIDETKRGIYVDDVGRSYLSVNGEDKTISVDEFIKQETKQRADKEKKAQELIKKYWDFDRTLYEYGSRQHIEVPNEYYKAFNDLRDYMIAEIEKCDYILVNYSYFVNKWEVMQLPSNVYRP